MADKDIITIYTDGGADPNPGVGGWGAVIIGADGIEDLSGGEPETTNNRMELTAAICALRSLSQPSRVKVFTDSQYLKNGITKWLASWVRRGWQRKDGELKNVDLWQELAKLVEAHKIEWSWVRGHSGNKHNERADALATEAIQRQRRGEQAVRSVKRKKAVTANDAISAAAGATVAATATDLTTVPSSASDYVAHQRVRCVDGRGAWAIVIQRGANSATLCGSLSRATANRLEIYAAVIALASLPEAVTVAVETSSDYLRKGATEWLGDWKGRGWRTAAGEPVKHVDIWKRLEAAMELRTVTWQERSEVAPQVDAELERLLNSVDRPRGAAGVKIHESALVVAAPRGRSPGRHTQR